MSDQGLRPTAPHAMWLYHPKKPDGVLFEAGSELPAGDGWTDQPPGTQEPEPEDMTGKIVREPPPPPLGAARAGEPMTWATILYHPIEAREGRTFPVGAIHPGDAWTDSPANFGHEARAELLPEPQAPVPEPGEGEAAAPAATAVDTEIVRLTARRTDELPPPAEPKVATLDEDGEPVETAAEPEPVIAQREAAAEPVKIPDKWAGLPHFNQSAIAKAILRARGDDVPKGLNKEAVHKIINGELAARAKA